jgi:hypothetical protein
MSKNAWLFRPNHVRRAIRTIESAGLAPSGVEFANGSFKVLIAGPKRAESDAIPEQQQAGAPPAARPTALTKSERRSQC